VRLVGVWVSNACSLAEISRDQATFHSMAAAALQPLAGGLAPTWSISFHALAVSSSGPLK